MRIYDFTGKDGSFNLENVSFPVTVVFSYVGYYAQAHTYYANPGGLTIGLQANDDLPEVVVTDKNEREENLRYFRKLFLGDDRYGEHATIRNEDVLFFEKECYNRKVVINAMGTEIDQEVVLFKASASEPLKIDLPLLGYELYVDLVTFEDEEVLDQPELSILGFFYYMPYKNGEEGKE